MAFESLVQFGYLGVAFFAVLYNYSGLPKLDWSHITAGALTLFTATTVEYLASGAALGAFAALPVLGTLSAALAVVGSLLVLFGAVKNVVAKLK